MRHNMIEKNNVKYIEGVAGETWIAAEQDILDFIVHCGEYDSNRILLCEENLAEDFFDLKTQFAGKIMQKLSTYSVRAAVVISEKRVKGRFGEMVLESRKFQDVRFFTDKAEAEMWLVRDVGR